MRNNKETNKYEESVQLLITEEETLSNIAKDVKDILAETH